MKSRRRNQRIERISIIIIVLAFLIAMSVSIIRLKDKSNAETKRIAELEQQRDDELQRAEELKAEEEYMKDVRFIIDIAKSKLGLAFDNEIIFKESDE